MIHPTAEVSEKAKLGKNVNIWHQAHIREDVEIGDNTIIGKNVYIDKGVKLGKNLKIQNNVSIYNQAEIKDGVHIGPHVCFTNDRYQRAINVDGTPKGANDWTPAKIFIDEGASIGAKSVLGTNIKIGKYALIGMGSVVTKDIPPYFLAYGNPARLKGYVCKCGRKVVDIGNELGIPDNCPYCNTSLEELSKLYKNP